MADPPFIVADRSLLSASGPSLIQYSLVFLIVFGIEKYFDGMRYLYGSPHTPGYGCDTSMYPNLWYHMIWDTISPSEILSWYVICDITPAHHKTPGKNYFKENRPLCCGLSFALAPCLCPLLALSPASPFLSCFCCPSTGHNIVLTVPPANTNLAPSRLGLLPECMIVYIPFFVFFPCLFFPLVIYQVYRMVSV